MSMYKADLNRLRKCKSHKNSVEKLPNGEIKTTFRRSGFETSRVTLQRPEMTEDEIGASLKRMFSRKNSFCDEANVREITECAKDLLAEMGLPREPETPEGKIYVWCPDGSWRIEKMANICPANQFYASSTIASFLTNRLGLGELDYPIVCAKIAYYGNELLHPNCPREFVIRFARRFELCLLILQRILNDEEKNSATGGGRKGAVWATTLAQKLVATAPVRSAKEHWESISEEFPNRAKDFVDLDERYFVSRQFGAGQEKLFVEDDDGNANGPAITFRTFEKHISKAKKKHGAVRNYD
ncbi:hypothetical protein [Hyphococcus sp. DH-69]|uniref:hypothetical protein n=1 Tax=Hyphococcus formosus TaxID=3143534 RepID=UPI00398BB5BB